MCVIDSILPADQLLESETGLPTGMLSSLQIEHDEASYRFSREGNVSKRAFANARLRIWATTQLSHRF